MQYSITAQHEQRSTAAHNTVVVDGQNSSEVWGGFRVARRAYPSQLSVDRKEDSVVVSASHTGYHRLPGKVTHTRTWLISSKGFSVRDEITEKCESFEIFLHFHPDSDANYPRLFLNDGSGLLFCSAVSPTPYTTYWHPEFGLSIRTKSLKFDLTNLNSLSNEFTCKLAAGSD